jgi:LacI family transcriptional regulator
MPTTLKDIAERVGKSVPTVSRALAGFSDISPQTRAEVQRVAEEMGYEPNITARNLQKQSTDTIALILPTARELRFSDPFFSEFLSGVVEGTSHHQYNLNISTSPAELDRETYLKHIRSRRFDGFVLVRTQRRDERIDLLREHDIPFAAFGRVDDENDFFLVDEDGYRAMRQIVDHLVGLGHTRLACIAEPMKFTKSYHRVQGFLDGLRSHGLEGEDDLVVETHFRQRSGRLAGAQLLDRSQPPTAIVACNDLIALGVLSAVQERGLVVGRDVSITGFDDILLAEYANPPLTTVHLPAHDLGEMVANLLFKAIREEPVDEKQIIIEPELVIRQSSGPAPAGR